MAQIQPIREIKSVNIDFPFMLAGAFRSDGKLATSFFTIKEQIDRAKAIGFNAVNFDTNVPIDAQTGKIDLFIENSRYPGNADKTFSGEVWKGIQYAESIGLATGITLHIRNALNDVQIQKGNVGPNFDYPTFFNSVKSFETELAEKAQLYGVDVIQIGDFNFGLLGPEFLESWSSVISSIRGVYQGALRYSMNVEAIDTSLWGLVDDIQLVVSPVWPLKSGFKAQDFVDLYFSPFIAGNGRLSQSSTNDYLLSYISRFPDKKISLRVSFQPGQSAGHELENPWSYVFEEDPLLENAKDQTSLRLFPEAWIDYGLNQQKIAGFLEYFGNYLKDHVSEVNYFQYTPWTEADQIRNPRSFHDRVWQSAVKAGSNLNWNPAAEKTLQDYFLKGWGFHSLYYSSDGNDRLTGSDADDVFFNYGAGPTSNGSGGSDTIDGGDGYDIFVFSGVSASYLVQKSSDTVTVSEVLAPERKVLLCNVEEIRFGDLTLALDTLPPMIAIASSSTSLTAGQTATISFTLSESSTTFTSSDVSVSGGTLSNFSGSGTSYSATFTPTANSTSNGVISVASGTFTDAAGNANADGSDANNTVTLAINTVASSGNDNLAGTLANDSMGGLAGNDTLTGLAGDDTLDGGAGNDSIVGGLGDDTYYVDSTGDRVVELANQGTDTVVSDISLSLAKVANVENWVGIGSADIAATGNALGNSLTGNSGANTIDGGLGIDTLTGGAGADRFVFSSKLGATNTDTITDFVSGGDKIQLSKSVFSKFKAGAVAQANFVSGGANTKALDSNDYLIFNGSQLLYDADGSGKGVAVVVANIVGTVVASDLVVV